MAYHSDDSIYESLIHRPPTRRGRPDSIDFHQTAGGKIRPAVVLLDAADDGFVAAPITSHSRGSAFDVSTQEWRSAGLNAASTIRAHTLTALAKTEIVCRLGELGNRDLEAVAEVLRRAFSLTG